MIIFFFVNVKSLCGLFIEFFPNDQLMEGFKSALFYLYLNIFQAGMMHELVDDIDDVLVDEVGPGNVDEHK